MDDKEKQNKLPNWLAALEETDLKFAKEFILCSGSLKDVAKYYDVSYPTVRLRLDRLIEKIRIYDTETDDSMVSLIKMLAYEKKISVDVASLLIEAYRREK